MDRAPKGRRLPRAAQDEVGVRSASRRSPGPGAPLRPALSGRSPSRLPLIVRPYRTRNCCNARPRVAPKPRLRLVSTPPWVKRDGPSGLGGGGGQEIASPKAPCQNTLPFPDGAIALREGRSHWGADGSPGALKGRPLPKVAQHEAGERPRAGAMLGKEDKRAFQSCKDAFQLVLDEAGRLISEPSEAKVSPAASFLH